jgi:hypothetical protein
MLRILTNHSLRQKIFAFGCTLLITLSSFIFIQQPVYASLKSSEKLTPEEKIDRAYEYNRAAGIRAEDREEAYEQAIKDAENLNTMEKAYERNVKAYKEENPEPNLIEKAEQLVEDVVTGKE